MIPHPFFPGMTTSWSGSCFSWPTWTRIRACWSCCSWRSWSTSSNPTRCTDRRCCLSWRAASSGSSGTPSSPTKTSPGTCDGFCAKGNASQPPPRTLSRQVGSGPPRPRYRDWLVIASLPKKKKKHPCLLLDPNTSANKWKHSLWCSLYEWLKKKTKNTRMTTWRMLVVVFETANLRHEWWCSFIFRTEEHQIWTSGYLLRNIPTLCLK